MRLRIAVVVLGFGFLLLVHFFPPGLPFMPESRFSDAATSHWPAALFLRLSVLERHEFPLWRETIMGGQPFAANPLNKTAYPLQWLALIFQPALHLNLLIITHMLLARWGMWRWARSLEIRDEAAVLVAVAYALSPKLMAHLGAGHLDLIYALAWWPWLMWTVKRVIDAPGSKHIVLMSLFAAMVFLADVRLSLFAFGFAAAYALSKFAPRQQWRVMSRFIIALPLFILLAMAVIVPLVAWSPYLSRSEMTQADAGVFSMAGGQLVGLVLPPHSGNPETVAYLGLPVLVLAGIAAFSAPRKHIFWMIAGLLAALYALGANGFLWPLLANILPFLLWFRVPARAWFVVVFAACTLAGYGLQTLMTTVENLRRDHTLARLAIKRLVIAGFAGASVFCGGFTLLVLTDLEATIGIGVIAIGLALGIVLLLGFYSRVKPETVAVMLIVVLFADLTWTGRNWLEWRAPDQWLTHQQALAGALRADGAARIYSPNYSLEQQVAAANGLRLFGGVDPFQLRGVVEAIEQGSGIPVEQYSVILPPLGDVKTDEDILDANRDAVPDTAVLAEWDVSHVVATYPIEHGRLEAADRIGDVYIYKNLDWPGTGQSKSWPDADTVNRLNNLTVAATVISGLSFVFCLVWIAPIARKAAKND
jgi:hypothetical protein